jgi:V/A-type H+-transporting ATPase subunit D
MLYTVSANRMTLLKLRKRLAMARRGHTLMKHKLDELMRIFQQEIKLVFDLRQEVESRLREIYMRFVLGTGLLREEAIHGILSTPLAEVAVELSQGRLLNLKVPVIEARVEMEVPPFGLLETTADLDEYMQRLKQAIPQMLKLAAAQRRLELLVREIEVTRRRVNALEYVLIPQIEQQVRFIQMKLDETERADISRLMRIKSIIRGES